MGRRLNAPVRRFAARKSAAPDGGGIGQFPGPERRQQGVRQRTCRRQPEGLLRHQSFAAGAHTKAGHVHFQLWHLMEHGKIRCHMPAFVEERRPQPDAQKPLASNQSSPYKTPQSSTGSRNTNGPARSVRFMAEEGRRRGPAGRPAPKNSKCRCGPVARPVCPAVPRHSPPGRLPRPGRRDTAYGHRSFPARRRGKGRGSCHGSRCGGRRYGARQRRQHRGSLCTGKVHAPVEGLVSGEGVFPPAVGIRKPASPRQRESQRLRGLGRLDRCSRRGPLCRFRTGRKQDPPPAAQRAAPLIFPPLRPLRMIFNTPARPVFLCIVLFLRRNSVCCGKAAENAKTPASLP